MRRPFTFSMQFTGPGGGAWTFHVGDGRRMLRRQVRIQGPRNMGTFGRLMPPETDDLALPINLEPRERVAP